MPEHSKLKWLEPGSVFMAAAASAAAVQSVRAFSMGAQLQDYAVTVALSWGAALWLTSQRRDEQRVSPGAAATAAGGLLWFSALVATLALGEYRALHRLLPLMAGVGLALAWGGVRGALGHPAALLALGLPLLNPAPAVVRRVLEPAELTAGAVAGILRAAGRTVHRDGVLLELPDGAVEVLAACSGWSAMAQLTVLAVLVMLLVPTSRAQKFVLLTSALALGFVLNAFRISILATLASPADEVAFAFWDHGRGASVFSLAETIIAGTLWWWMLRARSAAVLHPQLERA